MARLTADHEVETEDSLHSDHEVETEDSLHWYVKEFNTFPDKLFSDSIHG